MTQIVLIRPGSTDFSTEGRIQGNLDVPLNDKGNAEVAQLCSEMGATSLDLIYYSGTEPASRTAHLLAQALGVKCKPLTQLENMNQGLWQGLLVEEVRRKQPTVYRHGEDSPECLRPPGGEAVCDVQARVAGAMTKLMKKHREGTIGLVAPEPVASFVQAWLTRTEPRELWRGAKPCSWELISTLGASSITTGREA
jgi:phosphoserine phosphatase